MPRNSARVDLRAEFDQYDTNGSNTLSMDEVMKMVDKLGLAAAVDRAYIEGAWSVYDVDASGELDFKEFKVRTYMDLLSYVTCTSLRQLHFSTSRPLRSNQPLSLAAMGTEILQCGCSSCHEDR
jgi:hypothetical protein